GLMTVDKEVNQEVIKNNNNFQDGFTKIGKYYGEGYAMAGIPLIVYGSGLIFNSKSFRTTGRLLIESLAAAGLTTSLLKILIGRSRPYANDGEYKFNFFETKNIKNSLPSGHSTVAFTISTVLSERIDNIYASIGLYSLATLTAYQRVYSNNHWLSDTFLGAAIGITAGKFFSDLEEERNSRNRISFQIMPTLNSGNIGFNLVLHF
ncbi:MAG: phosphatase PAP2 family protein, partial [Ignavibacteriae bacterium]|nr:phosphatase PAP2 family protein [Ignavibacteriota bacterium]